MTPPPPATFQKRPVRVQALQLTDQASFQEAFLWVINSGGSASYAFTSEAAPAGSTSPGDAAFYVDTLEGRMTANRGDWLVLGTRGEFYPVKPEPFADTFDPVTTWPFACCEHCGCLDPTATPQLTEGHDDSCSHGCNDVPS
jgi:hypothetical protein